MWWRAAYEPTKKFMQSALNTSCITYVKYSSHNYSEYLYPIHDFVNLLWDELITAQGREKILSQFLY